MVFSEAVFLFLFLPVTLLVYYLPGVRSVRFRNIWLLLVSLGFYAWGEPVYVFLMVFSILVNWLLGLWTARRRANPAKRGKGIVALACGYNLGMLFVFKYLNWLLVGFGLARPGGVFDLKLPIGISFYTFQALSYVIDVYRGKDEAQRNIIDAGLYIAFFPQLIAGPIVRYGSIAEQLKNRPHSFGLFADGVWRFSIGLSKKLILADRLADIVKLTFENTGSGLSVAMSWVGALAVMMQIYFDFSGYSDMAIGLGRMFGFHFQENFNYPYIARSVTEFWRRWHISLGAWFRDYLFYPLSLGPAVRLRRAVAARTNRRIAAHVSGAFVLFVVWMSTGLWHGANLTFVVWGLLQFIFIFAEQYRKPAGGKKTDAAVGFVTTFLLVLTMSVLFQADSLAHAASYYASMFHLNGNSLLDAAGLYWIGQYKVFLTAGLVFIFPVAEKLGGLCRGRGEAVWPAVKAVLMTGLLAVDISYVFGGGYSPFIYFNF